MPFEMRLWQVAGDRLKSLQPAALNHEQRLEDWIAQDPGVLGMEVAIIGRQVQTEHGGRIDLLGIDRQGSCVVIELKRGRTPREVVAQTLDYGSWVADLEYADLEKITQSYRGKSLTTVFHELFGEPIPELVNASHNMVIVAAELDDSSERIIRYLSDRYGVSINAAFFSFFHHSNMELLGRAWLRDPVETIERSESRRRAPWTGYWFVNVGEGEHRNWDDNRRYGYLGAGQGERYSRPLQNLHIGDKVFAYMKGLGYVGFGEITHEAVPVKNFTIVEEGKTLLELPLQAPKASENSDSSERSEWAVGVRWLRTVDRTCAKTFRGAFANQNIVCKLRDPSTLEFLENEFGAKPSLN